MWAFTGNRIAVRFAYEWHDDSAHWYRSYGNENWEFNDDGLMASRYASINDLPISEADRKYQWALGRRPDNHAGLSDLGPSLEMTGNPEGIGSLVRLSGYAVGVD
jgi:nuclear transport factor 2 (NTF2) superfamily protein